VLPERLARSVTLSERPCELCQEQADLLLNGLSMLAQSSVFFLQPGQPLPKLLQFSVALPLGHQLRAVQSKPLDMKTSGILDMKTSGIGESNQHAIFPFADVLSEGVTSWV
jgi:hypothetical protein